MSDKLPDEVEMEMEQVERGCIAHDEFAVLPIGWRTADEVPPAHRYIALRLSIAKAIRDAEERVRDACAGLLTRLNRDHNAKDPEEAYAIGRFTRAIDAIRSLPLENA